MHVKTNGGPRAWLKGLVWFLFVVAVGFVAWAPLGPPFGDVFRTAVNLVLRNTTFGRGGHAEVQPGSASQDEPAGESWDTALILTIDSDGEPYEPKQLIINSRRIAYVPLLLSAAVLLTAPLTCRRKLMGAAMVLPGVAIAAILYVWAFAFCAFALIPGLVYDLRPVAASVVNLLFIAVLTPPGNRIVGPLVFATAVAAWHWLAEHNATSGSKINARPRMLASPKHD